MEFANIFLVVDAVLVSFGTFSHAKRYELDEVQRIAAIHADGKMKYLPDHPTTDTDGIPEEELMKMCVVALERFRDQHPERISELRADKRPEKLKPYLVARSLFGGLRTHQAVLPAYECPTNPPMYIHVDFDDKEDETTFEVMFVEPHPKPTIDDIAAFDLIVVKDIYDVDAEKIESMEAAKINISLYDFDELDERQRFLLCEKATLVVPLPDPVQLFENQPTGRSNFKILDMKLESKKGEDVDEGVIMQVFDCPSLPKTYVYVDGSMSEQHLWTIIKEVDLDPPFTKLF